jgi:hypothetical protein
MRNIMQTYNLKWVAYSLWRDTVIQITEAEGSGEVSNAPVLFSKEPKLKSRPSCLLFLIFLSPTRQIVPQITPLQFPSTSFTIHF